MSFLCNKITIYGIFEIQKNNVESLDTTVMLKMAVRYYEMATGAVFRKKVHFMF